MSNSIARAPSPMTREDVVLVVKEARERGESPDLRGADLRGASLRGVNLRGVNLRGANLPCADLRDADLSYAKLFGADLGCAILSGANLRYANLTGANLYGVGLIYADLRYAEIRFSDLRSAEWYGLCLDGLHRYRILLIPTPDGWRVTIGCWTGSPDNLRTIIAGDDWPEAQGDEITHRRPLLEAALHVVDAYIAAHPDVIYILKEKWEV